MNNVQAEMCVSFMALPQEQQMQALQKEGVYVGKLAAGDGGTALLYQYHTIYVEVFYSVYRKEVKEVLCFADTTVLDRYLSSNSLDPQGFI